MEELPNYIKLKSIINIDVFYDSNSLGFAQLDPIGISHVQDELRKTILNPVLITEVNPSKHVYFRGNLNMFKVATVVYHNDIWYLESFMPDCSLELAQLKFKEGKIIYTKAN